MGSGDVRYRLGRQLVGLFEKWQRQKGQGCGERELTLNVSAVAENLKTPFISYVYLCLKSIGFRQ